MIILASHGQFAEGLKQTAELIMGEQKNLFAFSAYCNGVDSVKELIRQKILVANENESIYILTDILGGSVNTEVLSLLNEFPDITVYSGMNLPLLIELLTISHLDLYQTLDDARKAIVLVNELLHHQIKEDDL